MSLTMDSFKRNAGRINSQVMPQKDLACAGRLAEERLGTLVDASTLVFPLRFPNSIVQMQKQVYP
jgi:hypothetical protein